MTTTLMEVISNETKNRKTPHIFGPDYYARLAGKPSGGGKLSAEVNGVSWPPPEQPRSPSPPPPELPKVAPPPTPHLVEAVTENLPEPPKSAPPPINLVETDGIHQALKAIVTPVEEKMPSSSLEVPSSHETKSVHQEETYVTSDSDLSYTNFYDVEHAQIVRKSKNEDVQIPIKKDIQSPPVAKPRVLTSQTKKENVYVKAPSSVKHRSLPPSEKPILRRYLSESSLLDDPFDAAPKVAHQKKDNTLISKIYKDPKVRLFALNSREEIPGGDGEYVKPIFQSQRSFDAKLAPNESYLNKGRSYNSSDDGITSEYESGKTGKMSFFSSEEDLLSLNSEASYRPVATKNEGVHINEGHFTRDRTPSPFTPRTLSTRKFIYGSQEDLLSVDEVSSIPRRKDNTIISKIYKNANVRNFALKTHRNFIPDYEPITPTNPKPHQEEIPKSTYINKYRSYDELSSADISLETYDQHQENNNEIAIVPSLYSNGHEIEEGYKSEDLDIEEIAKRHVVRQTLGKFSKSEVNVSLSFQRVVSLEDGENVRVSVRDLRKKFESNDGSNKPVISSLTARSLSKQVKDSLKK